MSVALSSAEQLMRVRSDFRMGAGAVFCDEESYWYVACAETVNSTRFEAMRDFGALELVITDWRAQSLRIEADMGYITCLAVPDDCGLDWVRAMAAAHDDEAALRDAPFVQLDTKPSVLHHVVLRICKMAQLLPAVLLVKVTREQIVDLPCFCTSSLFAVLEQGESRLQKISDAPLPISVSHDARVYVFRAYNGAEEHYAIQIGEPDTTKPVLTRLHSSCFTGDVIGSLKCDCRAQLHAALEAMGQKEAGILLYLNQEGRGIGLVNKMRAYTAQARGYDTVEANHLLGFEDDERNFRLGAEILQALGVGAVDLMTNNPAKVEQMKQAGIRVNKRVALRVGENAFNAAYLATKISKSGHIL